MKAVSLLLLGCFSLTAASKHAFVAYAFSTINCTGTYFQRNVIAHEGCNAQLGGGSYHITGCSDDALTAYIVSYPDALCATVATNGTMTMPGCTVSDSISTMQVCETLFEPDPSNERTIIIVSVLAGGAIVFLVGGVSIYYILQRRRERAAAMQSAKAPYRDSDQTDEELDDDTSSEATPPPRVPKKTISRKEVPQKPMRVSFGSQRTSNAMTRTEDLPSNNGTPPSALKHTASRKDVTSGDEAPRTAKRVASRVAMPASDDDPNSRPTTPAKRSPSQYAIYASDKPARAVKQSVSRRGVPSPEEDPEYNASVSSSKRTSSEASPHQVPRSMSQRRGMSPRGDDDNNTLESMTDSAYKRPMKASASRSAMKPATSALSPRTEIKSPRAMVVDHSFDLDHSRF